jgi:hypothetical protein
MLQIVNKYFIPRKVMIVHSGENEDLKNISPYAFEQNPVNGKTAAYVCRNFVCNMPLFEPDELKKLLESL